jgi:hypothetical protein
MTQMDLANVLKALWNDRRWVVVGAVVALAAALVSMFRISPLSLSLTPRSSDVAAATTEVLVDSQQTFLGDLRREVEPLTLRAGAYAHFVESEAVVDALARASKVPAREIAIHGPVANASEAADPTSEQRANDLRRDSEPYRVQVNFSGELPVLSIYTQAPTVDTARRLANGMATALRSVVSSIQNGSDSSLTRANSVRIRQLGTAQAGVVSESASYVLGVLVFIGVLGAACILILVSRNVGEAWRASDEAAASAGLDPVLDRPPPTEQASVTLADQRASNVEGIAWDDGGRHHHAATGR